MYRLLVVDDEPRHRRGMASMIRGLRKDYEVYEAQNGEAALQIIDSKNIDIIVTDIKMPRMDGLNLIEKLGKAIQEKRVVILSGYAHFEYAQKALNLGAFDYILKPVDRDKVVKMIYNVELSLEQQRLEKKEKENLKQQLDSTLPGYIHNLVNRWVYGLVNNNELIEIKRQFPRWDTGCVIIAGIQGRHLKNDSYSNQELREVFNNIKLWLEDTLSELGNSVCFLQEELGNAITAVLSTSDQLCYEGIIEMLGKFISKIKSYYKTYVTIGISDLSSDIYSEAPNMYRQAKSALDYRFYSGTGKVISYSEITDYQHKSFFNLYYEEDKLREAVKKRDGDQVNAITAKLFERIENTKSSNPQQITTVITYMVMDVLKSFEDMVENEAGKKLENSIESKLSKCEDCKELKNQALELLMEIISLLQSVKNNRNEIIVQRCLKFLEEHYMEELSLDSIAESYYFNTSYFSSLFKNCTGVTFSQYLLKLRLKKAQELLENTGIKVYEVAEKTGYKDSKYFIRIFKREFGMSPDEYRRILFGG